MLKFLFLGFCFLCIINHWGVLIILLLIASFLWGLCIDSFDLGVVGLIQLDNLSFLLGYLTL